MIEFCLGFIIGVFLEACLVVASRSDNERGDEDDEESKD